MEFLSGRWNLVISTLCLIYKWTKYIRMRQRCRKTSSKNMIRTRAKKRSLVSRYGSIYFSENTLFYNYITISRIVFFYRVFCIEIIKSKLLQLWNGAFEDISPLFKLRCVNTAMNTLGCMNGKMDKNFQKMSKLRFVEILTIWCDNTLLTALLIATRVNKSIALSFWHFLKVFVHLAINAP